MDCMLFPDILHRATPRSPLLPSFHTVRLPSILSLAPLTPLPLQEDEQTFSTPFLVGNPEQGLNKPQFVGMEHVFPTTHSINATYSSTQEPPSVFQSTIFTRLLTITLNLATTFKLPTKTQNTSQRLLTIYLLFVRPPKNPSPAEKSSES